MERVFVYFLVAAVALVALSVVAYTLYTFVRQLVATYLKFRGQRVVVCPETRDYVAVEVDAARAARSAVAEGAPELRLQACTRWPARAGCDQDCLSQIERAPEDCAVRTILADYFRNTDCVLCGRAIGEINWHEHKPAFMRPDHVTVDWRDVPPEQLPGVFVTHQPVCWNCHVASSFAAAHPDLVVERPWVH